VGLPRVPPPLRRGLRAGGRRPRRPPRAGRRPPRAAAGRGGRQRRLRSPPRPRARIHGSAAVLAAAAGAAAARLPLATSDADGPKTEVWMLRPKSASPVLSPQGAAAGPRTAPSAHGMPGRTGRAPGLPPGSPPGRAWGDAGAAGTRGPGPRLGRRAPSPPAADSDAKSAASHRHPVTGIRSASESCAGADRPRRPLQGPWTRRARARWRRPSLRPAGPGPRVCRLPAIRRSPRARASSRPGTCSRVAGSIPAGSALQVWPWSSVLSRLDD
jgi:hypothetical protein